MVDSCFTFIISVAALVFFLPGLWFGLTRRLRGGKGTFMLCAPDEDIRIVTGSPSASLRAFPDTGESVAREFRRHKENGNIFMANRLGEELAKPLLRGDGALFEELWQAYAGQICFLYALAVRGAVGKKIENTILADTVLHSFSETVENSSPEIYQAINDSVADTIYRLCLADGQKVGSGFSKLCGKDGEAEFTSLGERAYERFWNFSSARIDRITFQ